MSAEASRVKNGQVRKILSVDIGGSKILVGIIDENGKVLVSKKQLFDHPTQEKVEAAIVLLADEILSDSSWKEDPEEEICCIGASIPGLCDSANGLWVYAPFSGIRDFHIVEFLEKRYHKPAFIENDINLCAVGERRFGHGKNTDSFFWQNISTGCGGGIILNGRLLRGSSNSAAETGHIKVVDNGAPCPCGGHGCLEAYASAPGIVRQYRELTGKELTAYEISLLARDGDSSALKIFDNEGLYLAKVIGAVVNTLNLPLVVIGGGVSGSFDLFYPAIQKYLPDYLFMNANPALEIKPTALGYEAALISAAAYALYGLEKNDI